MELINLASINFSYCMLQQDFKMGNSESFVASEKRRMLGRKDW